MTIVTQTKLSITKLTYKDLVLGDFFIVPTLSTDIYIKTNIVDDTHDYCDNIMAVRISGYGGIGNRCRFPACKGVDKISTLSLDVR